MFAFPGTFVEAIPYGNGHINDTYRLTFEQSGRLVHYILQQMNRKVFRKPEELMENIEGVTAWLKKKIQENGGDIYRETLNVIPSAEGKAWCVDDTGEYWRAYYFIENALCLDQAAGTQDFYESAVAFGHFQRLLSDYPADTLHETIPDFHNTPDRFRKFRAAVEADVCGRAAAVQDEIRFVMEREAFTHTLMDRLAEGKLPLRVTHNDTKLNNIMLDEKTRKGICVIDLDTVMPGLSVNDFGDSIRFGASTGAEDEPDLTKISCDLDLFENRLVRILAKPEKLHSHPGQHLKLGVRRACSDNRHLQITGRIVIIQIVKIRNDLIAQLQKINQLRINKRFQQNTNNVRILSVRYSLFFWNLTHCL